MLWSSKLPQDADFGSWKDRTYPKTPDGWNRYALGTVVAFWQGRHPIASVQRAFDEATASAWKTHQGKTSTRNAYDEATAPAGKAYNEVMAPAEKTYGEAIASAEKAYAEAEALAKIDFNLALAENLSLLLDPPPSRIVLYNADTDKWVETPDPQEASRLASLAVWEGQKFMEKLFEGEKEVRKAFEGGERVQFGRRRAGFEGRKSVFVGLHTRRRRALF